MAALPPSRKLTLCLFPTLADCFWRVGAVEPGPPVRGVKNVAFTTGALCGEEEWPRCIKHGHVRRMRSGGLRCSLRGRSTRDRD